MMLLQSAVRRAVLVVEEHQVDVAGVIQFLAAELAERQDDATGRLAAGDGRLAEARSEMLEGRGQGDLEGGVGDAGDVARDFLQRAVADDVVGADAQQLCRWRKRRKARRTDSSSRAASTSLCS